MGSSPLCDRGFLCCAKAEINVPKSDLFVPHVSFKIKKKTSQKKIKSLKTYTLTKKKGLKGLGRMTTERIISNSFGLKDSPTMKRNLRIKEKWRLSNKYYNKLNTYSFVKVHKSNINIINEKIVYDKYQTFDINKTYFPKNKEEKDSNTDEKTNNHNNNLGNNNYNINANMNNHHNNLDYEFSEHYLDSTEEMNINNILLYHYLFHTTSKNNLQFIISELREFNVENGTVIFYENDIGSCMFIIKKGKVKLVTEDSDNVIYLEDGNVFGELVMVQDEEVKRTYTAIADSELILYTLDKSAFANIEDSFIKFNPFEFSLFNFISEEEKINLELLATSIEFKKDQTITDLKGLFWIKKGSICLYDSNNKEKDTYGPNEIIGVEKLSNTKFLENQEKNVKMLEKMKKKIDSKIIATKDVLCTVLPDFAFIEIFGIDYIIKLYASFLKETLCINKTFEIIFDSNKTNDIAKLFNIKEYRKGESITSKTNHSKKIGIILMGEAYYEEENKEIKENKENNNEDNKDKTKKILITNDTIIGAELFENKEQKYYSVESNHLIMLECDYDTFLEKIEIFGTTIKQLVNELTSIYFFNGLKISKLIEISRNLTKIKSKKDEKIIKEGDKVELIYFIIDGAVKFIEDKEVIREYHKGNSFGEIFVFHDKPAFGEIIVDSEECTFFKMTKQYYFELLSDLTLNNKAKKKLCLEDNEIFPSSLYYISTLHKSKTNNIYIVHNKIWIYIMKAIYIPNFYLATASEGKMIPNILNEKWASRIIDNLFFVKYVKTLKNNSWCFFLEEYINGIKLSELLQTVKLSGSISFCIFHFACLILIIESLHELGIIHRDIKPENYILTKNGYPKLIDFSCCKKIDSNKTRTIVGSPLFISPEVLMGSGYSYSCDYWGIGVFIYYLFFGEYPFGSRATQPDTIYEEIINKKININENFMKKFNNNTQKAEKAKELKELIEILLNKKPEERMKNVGNLKERKLFENIDFNKLKKMEIKAPYIPKIEKFDYQKLLKNTSKPFLDFIPEHDEKIKNSINDVIVVNRDKRENFLEYHKNLMRWFEKF